VSTELENLANAAKDTQKRALLRLIDQKYSKELTAVEQLIAKIKEMVLLKHDLKLVMQSYLSHFFNSLNVVRKISKDKRMDADVQKYLIAKLLQKEFQAHSNDLLCLLKEIVIVRQRDRSIRENCIKAIKITVKLNPQLTAVLKSLKIHVYVTFILEREFKNPAVAKERM
jgi:hypothetical protein